MFADGENSSWLIVLLAPAHLSFPAAFELQKWLSLQESCPSNLKDQQCYHNSCSPDAYLEA